MPILCSCLWHMYEIGKCVRVLDYRSHNPLANMALVHTRCGGRFLGTTVQWSNIVILNFPSLFFLHLITLHTCFSFSPFFSFHQPCEVSHCFASPTPQNDWNTVVIHNWTRPTELVKISSSLSSINGVALLVTYYSISANEFHEQVGFEARFLES